VITNLLSPKEYSPETIAVRSQDLALPEIRSARLPPADDEKSAQFHEKWGGGLRSRLGGRACRFKTLPSKTPWRAGHGAIGPTGWPPTPRNPPAIRNGTPDAFHVPVELDGHPLRDDSAHLPYAVRDLRGSLEPVRAVVAKAVPQREGEKTKPGPAHPAHSMWTSAASAAVPRWPTWA